MFNPNWIKPLSIHPYFCTSGQKLAYLKGTAFRSYRDSHAKKRSGFLCVSFLVQRPGCLRRPPTKLLLGSNRVWLRRTTSLSHRALVLFIFPRLNPDLYSKRHCPASDLHAVTEDTPFLGLRNLYVSNLGQPWNFLQRNCQMSATA